MTLFAKLGAAAFIAWGVIHILGGAAILAALGESPDAGFATYRQTTGHYDDLAGSILGYFSFLLIVIGAAAATIGWRLNWHNSHPGLAVNTLLIGLVEIGLVWFLVLPGYVDWAQASIGLVPFVLATISSGIACQQLHGNPA